MFSVGLLQTTVVATHMKHYDRFWSHYHTLQIFTQPERLGPESESDGTRAAISTVALRYTLRRFEIQTSLRRFEGTLLRFEQPSAIRTSLWRFEPSTIRTSLRRFEPSTIQTTILADAFAKTSSKSRGRCA